MDNTYAKLGTLSGYAVVKEVKMHVSSKYFVGATETEMSEIENRLKGGIIL